MRIFVNEQPLEVAAGNSVRAALAAFDRALLAAVESGSAYVTDGVGRPIAIDATLPPGAILRVGMSARRQGGTTRAESESGRR